MLQHIRSMIASLLGTQSATPLSERTSEPTLTEEFSVVGFDRDGEPVIKKWSDGSIWFQFEAMPPFFAEERGTMDDFDDIEQELRSALGVAVEQEDREVFVIRDPAPDTVERARAWLGNFHDREGARGDGSVAPPDGPRP